MDVEAELAAVRRNAEELARYRVDQMQRKLWRDGKADRAAMGKPDPTFGDLIRAAGVTIAEFIENVRKAFS